MGRIGCEGRYLVGSSCLEQADVGLDPGRFSAEENLRAYSRHVHLPMLTAGLALGTGAFLQAEIVELCAVRLESKFDCIVHVNMWPRGMVLFILKSPRPLMFCDAQLVVGMVC